MHLSLLFLPYASLSLPKILPYYSLLPSLSFLSISPILNYYQVFFKKKKKLLSSWPTWNKLLKWMDWSLFYFLFWSYHNFIIFLIKLFMESTICRWTHAVNMTFSTTHVVTSIDYIYIISHLIVLIKIIKVMEYLTWKQEWKEMKWRYHFERPSCHRRGPLHADR